MRIVLFFGLLTAVLLAMVGLLSYRSGTEGLQTAAVTEMLGSAVEKEAALDTWLEERLADLGQIALHPDVVEKTAGLLAATADSDEARAAHDLLVTEFEPHLTGSRAGFLELFVMEPDGGRVVVSTRPAEEGKSKVGHPFFDHAKDALDLHTPYISNDLGAPAMTAAIPLRAVDGRVVAVLAARLDLAALTAIACRGAGLRKTEDAFLINADRFLVTQPRFLPASVVLRRQLETDSAFRCAARENGVVFTTDYRGVPAIAVYRWIAKHQLGLIVKVDQAEALAPARGFGWTVILISSVALLATAGLAVLLARTITRPLRKLHARVRQFADGGRNEPWPESTDDELGLLAREFNTMAGRVVERTDDLARSNVALQAENTERMRAEEQLRAQATALEAAANGIVIADASGTIQWVNPAFTQLTGYSREEVVGQNPRILKSGTQRDSFYRNLWQTIASGQVWRGELINRRKDGSLYSEEMTITPVRDAAGIMSRYIAIKQDVSERKAAEARRRAEEERHVRQRDALITFAGGGTGKSDNLTGTLRQLTEVDAQSLGVARVSIWRYNHDRTAIRCVDLYELAADRHSDGFELSAADYPAYFRALAGEKVIAAEDVHRDDRTGEFSETYLRPLGITSMLDAPIHMGGAVHGVLCHEHVGPARRWTADEETFAVAVANLASLALEGAERHRAEHELRSAHAQLAHMFAHSPAVVYRLKVEGERIIPLTASANLTRLLGFAVEETLSMEWWLDRLHPVDRERALASIPETMQQGTSRIEYRLRHKEGHYRWVDDNRQVLRDADGRPIEIIGVWTDVTERKQAEAALHASLEEFRTLAEAMPQIVWITRPDGAVVYINQRWMDYTGLALEESLGHGWSKPFHPDDQPRAEKAWQHATVTGTDYTIESRLRRADGIFRWWLMRGGPVRDAAGTIIKWFGTCTDIHDLKIAGIEISRSNQALHMLGRCNEAVIRAEEEVSLLRSICQIATDVGSFRMAWVGYVQDDETGAIAPQAHAGVEDGYLAGIRVSSAKDDATGEGPAGQCIRSGQPVVVPDVSQWEAFDPWRERARARGYRGVIVLPLRDQARTFGMLALYMAEAREILPGELNVLQELADNLAFGVLVLRARVEQRQTHEAVLAMARGISVSAGNEFFEQVTRSMAQALGAHAAFIARFDAAEPGTAQTLAAVVAGKTVPNFAYRLAGTPSEGLDQVDPGVVPRDARRLFPQAQMMGKLGIEACVETRLVDAAGRPLGLMSVQFQQPLARHEFITSTLQIFAARAASEIQRQDADAITREQAALLDAASDAIILKDLAGRILFWNCGAEQIFGWPAAEAVGQGSRELLHFEPGKFDDALRLLRQHEHWYGELQTRTRDGRTLTMEVRWTLVRDEAGEPKSILAINTDITERKALEAKFLRVQRLESIGALAGGIAHDFNNILAPILMSVALLQREVKSEMGRSMLATLHMCAQRGADLVGQVLSFARGVEGKRITVNLVHLLRDIQKIVRETFPKNIEFIFRPSPDLQTVTGDPTQLHQVFMNMCVNARDAMPNGGTLAMTIANVMLDEVYAGMNPEARPGPYLVVEVADTGTGIRPAHLERIFEPFFTTKEVGKGTGLGLSTSLGIVRGHGGFITVYSEPARGTQFKVHLPANTRAEVVDVAAVEPGAIPHGAGELVLVVDDEESIRSIAQLTLERHGYHVLLAANGAEAVALYAAQRDLIAVVLTDMAMPVMDGPSTIIALKALNPQVRIIGSSGLAADARVAKAQSAGVHYFVPKPYTAAKMLVVLAQVLHEAA